MKHSYVDIVKHSGIYGFGQVLSRVISFLLLPLYTSYLRPMDFGCIAILDVTVAVLGLLIGAGMAHAVNRYHFDTNDEEVRDQVWWTGVLFLVMVATGIVVPAWLLRESLAHWALGPEQFQGGYFFGIVLVTLWCTSSQQLLNQYLRVRKWSILAVTISVGAALLNVAFNVYFLVVLHLGVAAVLWGNLISTVLATCILFVIFVRTRGPIKFHRRFAAELWWFGFPLVVSSFLAMIMHQADRYLLRHFSDLSQVGIYSVAYTVAQGVNTLVLLPFTAIWNVVVYEVASRNEAKMVYVTVFKYFMYTLALILLGVSMFAEPMLRLVVADDYLGAAQFIPILCLGYLFFSMHGHFRIPALLSKQTIQILPAYVLGASINLGLNFVLIPQWGSLGAAVTTVVTFGAFSFFGLLYYRRIDRYPYPWFKVTSMILGIVVTFLIYRSLSYVGITVFTHLGIGALIWLGWAALLFGPLGFQLLAAHINFDWRPFAEKV